MSEELLDVMELFDGARYVKLVWVDNTISGVLLWRGNHEIRLYDSNMNLENTRNIEGFTNKKVSFAGAKKALDNWLIELEAINFI